MKQRGNERKEHESQLSSTQAKADETPRYELPIDLDEILAVAVFDSVLRVKQRKFKTHGSARRK
jgi:hypothetical protein